MVEGGHHLRKAPNPHPRCWWKGDGLNQTCVFIPLGLLQASGPAYDVCLCSQNIWGQSEWEGCKWQRGLIHQRHRGDILKWKRFPQNWPLVSRFFMLMWHYWWGNPWVPYNQNMSQSSKCPSHAIIVKVHVHSKARVCVKYECHTWCTVAYRALKSWRKGGRQTERQTGGWKIITIPYDPWWQEGKNGFISHNICTQ